MLKRIALAVLVLVVLWLSFANLDRVPPLWWDEGWTMNVARNWVEQGHYGQLLNGQPASPGLSAAFPSVASIALSFKLFGVGIWQARLPGVLYTLGALILLYLLARRLFDRQVAFVTLVVALCLAPDPFLQPIFVGRQVLAELPMMFYLLGGYVFFWLGLRRSVVWLLPALGLWGIALISKAQVLPFWVASLGAPLLVTLLKRRWKLAGFWLVGLVGSYAASQGWLWLQSTILADHVVGSAPLVGLLDVTAFVLLNSDIRIKVLLVALQLGLLTMLGLGYGVWSWFRRRQPEPLHPATAKRDGQSSDDGDLGTIRLALLVLAGSWLLWYALFSSGPTRYLFPAVFVGSMFVAALICAATDRLNWRAVLNRLALDLKRRRLTARTLGTVSLAALCLAMLILNLKWLIPEIVPAGHDEVAVIDVTDFLNTHTPPQALIETYDSELLFLLDRPYHFPPDQLHVDLIRQLMSEYALASDSSQFYSGDAPISYDPLAANPDFLVVGLERELWHRPYDAVLATNAFRPIYSDSRYTVYERVR